MSDTTMLHIRVDSELKSEATEAFKKMGLSPSEAVRVFLTRVVAEQAMPFDVRVPNVETQAAIRELREGRSEKSGPAKSAKKTKAAGKPAVAHRGPGRPPEENERRFNSVAALMADLSADD